MQGRQQISYRKCPVSLFISVLGRLFLWPDLAYSWVQEIKEVEMMCADASSLREDGQSFARSTRLACRRLYYT